MKQFLILCFLFLIVNSIYSQKINLNDTNKIHILSNVNHENIERLLSTESIDIIKKFAIYDRWGNSIFETEDINHFRWYGKSKNGNLISQGTYTCVLLLKDNKTRIIRRFDFMP